MTSEARNPDGAFWQAQLEAAEAEAARIRREIAQGPCREFGHDWRHHGGANAVCDLECSCSVPVHVCSKCGDCDYGQNPEAEQKRAECAAGETAGDW
jgi:hypothetical protein